MDRSPVLDLRLGPGLPNPFRSDLGGLGCRGFIGPDLWGLTRRNEGETKKRSRLSENVSP